MRGGPEGPYRGAPDGDSPAPSVSADRAERAREYGPLLVVGLILGCLGATLAQCGEDVARRLSSKRPTPAVVTLEHVLTQLRAIDLGPCRTVGGPTGPGFARVDLVNGRVADAGLVEDSRSFDARFQGTTTGACVVARLVGTPIDRLPFNQSPTIEFLVPPETGPAFDRRAMQAALEGIDLSACRARGEVSLVLEPSGRIRILDDGIRKATHESLWSDQLAIEQRMARYCVEDAYRRARTPVFAGSPVYVTRSVPR